MAFNTGGALSGAASGASAGSAAGPWGAAIGGIAGGLLGGFGGGGDKPPKPPDYAKAAAKERQWDKAMWERQLREGRRGTTGPTGGIRYDNKGRQIVTLAPQQRENLALGGQLQEDVLRGERQLTGRRVESEADRLRRIQNLRGPSAQDYRGRLADAAGGRDYREAVRDVATDLLPRQEDLWRDRSRSEDAYTDYLMGKIKSGQKLTDDEQRAFQGRLSTEQAARDAQKAWYEFQSGNLAELQDMFGQVSDKFSNLNLPELGAFDPNYAAQLGDQMYGSVMSRLAPEQARAEEAMGNRLRAQGLQPGTEAYDRALRNLLTSQGDVRSKAALDAQAAAWQEARGRRSLDIDAYRAAQQGGLAELSGLTSSLGQFGQMFQPSEYRAGSAPGADQSLLLQAGSIPQFQSGLAPNAGEVSQLISGGGYSGDPGAVMTTPNLPAAYLPGAPPQSSGSFMEGAKANYQAGMGNWNAGQQQQADWLSSIGPVVGGLADWWTNRG